jgi:hypothetical protein
MLTGSAMDTNIEQRKLARFWAAAITFTLIYAILVARYDLWGLGLGWLPAGLAGAIAGYFFYRVWWLGYAIVAIIVGIIEVLGALMG